MEKRIKIEIKLQNQVNLKANANIQLLTVNYGWVTIKDYQIWKSPQYNQRLNESINITPPSIKPRTSTKYIKRVFFEDDKKWAEVEKLIFEEYQNKLNETAPIDYDAIDQS